MNLNFTVFDIMTTKLITIGSDANTHEAISLLLKNQISGLPVVENSGKLVGILSEKDCLKLLTGGSYYQLPGGTVKDFMTTDVFCIPAYTDIFKVADMFLNHYFRRIVIKNDDGCVAGQITRRDLLRIIKELHLKEDKEQKIAPIM